jgi:hypothetical protein
MTNHPLRKLLPVSVQTPVTRMAGVQTLACDVSGRTCTNPRRHQRRPFVSPVVAVAPNQVIAPAEATSPYAAADPGQSFLRLSNLPPVTLAPDRGGIGGRPRERAMASTGWPSPAPAER